MIIELICNFLIEFLDIIFGWVRFPPMPLEIEEPMIFLFESISSAIGFVWLIVPRGLVLAVLPVIIIVENFDRLYSIVMWILKKIPFLGMQ